MVCHNVLLPIHNLPNGDGRDNILGKYLNMQHAVCIRQPGWWCYNVVKYWTEMSGTIKDIIVRNGLRDNVDYLCAKAKLT